MVSEGEQGRGMRNQQLSRRSDPLLASATSIFALQGHVRAARHSFLFNNPKIGTSETVIGLSTTQGFGETVVHFR